MTVPRISSPLFRTQSPSGWDVLTGSRGPVKASLWVASWPAFTVPHRHRRTLDYAPPT